MSTSTIISEEGSVSSGLRDDENISLKALSSSISSHHTKLPELKPKKKRNKPGNPDPDAEVVALSPRTLTSTNKYSCEVCGKGFQREQNLQLHRRGHNLPWKLKHRDGGGDARKKVYVCPEESCAHHHPSRALGDLTGIKKHFLRKHGEKRWTCERCSKKYAVLSDWKAHSRACGTREYRCDCGTIFSRKDSFATHRAFCDALAEESARITAAATAAAVAAAASSTLGTNHASSVQHEQPLSWEHLQNPNPNPIRIPFQPKAEEPPLLHHHNFIPCNIPSVTQHLSSIIPSVSQHVPRTTLLQSGATARQLSRTSISISCTTSFGSGINGFGVGDLPEWQRGNCLLTRDFLGMTGEGEDELLSFNGSGGLNYMASTSGASYGCSSHASAAVTNAPKPESGEGSGFPHLPNAVTSQAWWRLLG